MNTKYDFTPDENGKIVYVRPVAAANLPEALQSQIGKIDTVYSVHNTSGEQLALVKDRGLAFALARQNDLSPVNVH